MTDIVQGSDAWRQLRLGKVTASRVADVVAKLKTGGWGASRSNYAAELILERLTGQPTIGFVSSAMQFGIETEPEARAAYEFMSDTEVLQVGFVPHPTIAEAGCSPDGLVDDSGLVEFKVPNPATHLETLLGASIAGGYLQQMQFQMACTGRKWCDFVSYHPSFPERMRLCRHRIKRDDALIASLEKEVVIFLAEIDAKVAELIARYERRAA